LTHPMRRPRKIRPPDVRFSIIVQLRLSEACCGKLQKVNVVARHGGDDQLWMLLSQSRDELYIGIKALAIHHLLEIGEQLWRVV